MSEEKRERKKSAGKESTGKKHSIFFYVHLLLIVTFIAFLGAVAWKFYHFGVVVDPAELEEQRQYNEQHPELYYYTEVLDFIIPLIHHTDDYVKDGENIIAFFGNNPFANDRDSADNPVNIVREKTNATVYNFSLKDTFLSCISESFDMDYPEDAYSFYRLIELATDGTGKENYPAAAEAMEANGGKRPEYADEVVEQLLSTDFNKVDTVVIMYDALDYLEGRRIYDDHNDSDISTFTGALVAGIRRIQEYCPNTRIIVMSPTYAYYVDENGEYQSSDQVIINENSYLSTYMIKEQEYAIDCNVTFVDNIYGTVTAANARECLTDNYNLNAKGRMLVADRLIYALTFYDKD